MGSGLKQQRYKAAVAKYGNPADATSQRYAQQREMLNALRKCSRPRCNGDMLPGVAMGQTFTGIGDFQGREVVTLNPGGPGVIVQCIKCTACGHSVSA